MLVCFFSFQLQELKGVINKTETEYSDKIDQLTKQHKKALAENEERTKKLEAAKEKVEKSKEEAIQNLNEKIR
jgi:F0F1-type ATP synthase membrane subunit b/b'